MDTVALLLTIRLALVTTVILLLLAVPLAYWLAFTGSRAKVLVQAICALPIVLPPTVLGFYLLVGLGPRTAFGRAMSHLLGHPLAFSFAGLVVGSVLYSLPFAVQPLTAGFAAVDRSMLDAATTLGSGRWDRMMRVVLPLSRGSLLAAGVLSFAHTVGEFGVVLMIGGNLPGATRTLSIALYDQVQDFQYAQANRTALFLLAICLVALMLLYGQHPRRNLPQPNPQSNPGSGDLV
jgi:molybdate transport system permease protein